jgi:hypothetical protein
VAAVVCQLSIFFGEQQCGGRAIGLGDDPNLDVLGGAVGAEDAEAVRDGELILVLVLVTELAPVPIPVTYMAD